MSARASQKEVEILKVNNLGSEQSSSNEISNQSEPSEQFVEVSSSSNCSKKHRGMWYEGTTFDQEAQENAKLKSAEALQGEEDNETPIQSADSDFDDDSLDLRQDEDLELLEGRDREARAINDPQEVPLLEVENASKGTFDFFQEVAPTTDDQEYDFQYALWQECKNRNQLDDAALGHASEGRKE